MRKTWTKEEIEILVNNKDKTAKEIAGLLFNKTTNAVENKRNRLKLASDNRWSKKEMEILNENKNKTLEEIAILLPKRSISSIQSRRFNCGLSNRSLWSQEEDEILLINKDKPMSEIFKLLPNRSSRMIKKRRWKIGLNFSIKNREMMDYQFTDRQKSVIVGSLLGDGTLSKCDTLNQNSEFNEHHCLEQCDWLKWKENELKPFPTRFSFGEHYGIKNLSKEIIVKDKTIKLKYCGLSTIVHPYFTELEKIWYKRDQDGDYVYKIVGNGRKQRIKIIPSNLKLDPLTVAVWFLDDGNNRVNSGINSRRKQCRLATNCFTKDEVYYLLSKIKEIGFTDSDMYESYKGSNQYTIYIKSKSFIDFINYIKLTLPDIPDCMKYKIDLTNYKLAFQESRSKINDNVVDQIIKDVKNNMTQREIAKKHNISYWTINRLLVGKTYQGTIIDNSLNYQNSSGITNFCFNEKKKVYIGSIIVNNKTLYLGRYKEKEIAEKISRELRILKKNKCENSEEYFKIIEKYK